jgi:predicted O-linked N-acetylglucosamine transferase (SPINDLY family)
MPPRLWQGEIYRHDKIRIAYLSSDFREHPCAYMMAELFERHDRSRFEVHAVSFGADDGGEMRARLVKAFDHFHDVRGVSDADAARLLHRLKLDIAIDLNGHTLGARPKILAARPCPVQATYIGTPAALGADFIDYVIADKIILPFDQQPFFTEKIIHLPDSYWVTDSTRQIGEAPSRSEAGLPQQGFVFCCFNNNWKITRPVFDIWMRLLNAVPGSVLWLLDDNKDATARLCAEAASRGVDPQRLVFAPRLELKRHLPRHRLADLFLDTLP